MSCPHAGGCGQGSRYDLVSNAVVPWLVSFSYKKMVFKHLPLSTQLFTWCNDSLHFTCCSLFCGRLFKQLLQILFALCLGCRSLLSKGFQCLGVFLFQVPNLVI